MSWNLLERFIESEHFNKDPSLTVAYLARYSQHVGIHYVLCSKLRQFSYEEIEFFLPQLCHLLVSVENESMALEEFIVDLCEESVNGALLTFWLFQTYLHDLSSQPTSHAFRTCRRIYHKAQRIVFGGSEPLRREQIHENVLPVTVLASLVTASAAVPLLARHVAPLAVAQSRKARPAEDGGFEDVAHAKMRRSNTVAGTGAATAKPSRRRRQETGQSKDITTRRVRATWGLDVEGMVGTGVQLRSPRTGSGKGHNHSQSVAVPKQTNGYHTGPPSPRTNGFHHHTRNLSGPGVPRRLSEMSRKQSPNHAPTLMTMSQEQKARLLRQNYFRCEMQFLTALEWISSRLVAVPKPARLSALRAELALIARDLPAEVDIPIICPPTLVEGSASRSRHHRIVRLNPAEATSLNSAEKVPYLLMLEILQEDFDFDTTSAQNEDLLAQIAAEKGRPKRRLFDTSDATRDIVLQTPEDVPDPSDNVFESANGDLSDAALLQDPALMRSSTPSNGFYRPYQNFLKEPPRNSIAITTFPPNSPRISDGLISRSSSPGFRSSSQLAVSTSATSVAAQADVSALADHMRTASQMLAQLELSAAKRPKTEVAAIKAKIIASMQSLEEQNFLADDHISGGAIPVANFDTIIARANEEAAHITPEDFADGEVDAPSHSKLNSGRGADRMENDAKTGGLRRLADRDDPSAAMFGEAWEAKKDRIRRSSPYGWAPNWDLVSVIVKTGDDLRQEAFACQLIAVCAKIWGEYGVNVWVKKMRILVTGESSGLIETITDAVSLHSIKRSLTLSSSSGNLASAPGTPIVGAPSAATAGKKRFATLQDHFLRSFGPVDSPAYTSAIEAFTQSLAAYSIISYLLQLKDRHNGNILIDSEGHVVHIDFGFMLSNSPGNMAFEAAPFKLTLEYLELLGGVSGPAFLRFKELMKIAFQALRREAERILMLVELMGRGTSMAAFSVGGVTGVVAALRQRFVLEKSEAEAREWVEELVGKSLGSYYTRLYDVFQYRTQGIY